MRLLLMRHGEAVPGSDQDSGRRLTAGGRAALTRPAESVQSALLGVVSLWSSPWLRAQETAGLMQPYTQAGDLTLTEALLPSADPREILPLLEMSEDHTLLLVGHQPLVGRLAALLCEGPQAHPWAFSPADLAVIDLDWPAAGLGYLRRWHHFPV